MYRAVLAARRGGGSLASKLFAAMAKSNRDERRKCTAGWYRKAMGIPRRTYYNLVKNVRFGTAA